MANKKFNFLKISSVIKEHKKSIVLSKSLGEVPLKSKQVPTQTYADLGKQRYCDRLYVWGYTGVGALGNKTKSNLKKTIFNGLIKASQNLLSLQGTKFAFTLKENPGDFVGLIETKLT